MTKHYEAYGDDKQKRLEDMVRMRQAYEKKNKPKHKALEKAKKMTRSEKFAYDKNSGSM